MRKQSKQVDWRDIPLAKVERIEKSTDWQAIPIKRQKMKILSLDIETAPNLAYVWGLFKENINVDRIVASGHVLCWSAKWYGEPKIYYSSVQRRKPAAMLAGIHRLLDKADVVLHYNGKSFDIPTLNKEFVGNQLSPPSPYKQIDLLQIVRAEFRFPSNKLDYVAQALGLGKKVRHPGFEMWIKCMAGEDEAWQKMKEYNHQDVLLLEKLYDRLQPWIRSHPNHGAFEGATMCPKCGSEEFQRRGYAYTAMMRYPRYQCNKCHGWFRGTKAEKRGNEERMMNIGA